MPGAVNNAAFEIVGDQLRTRFPLNYEVKTAFTIRVRVTDAGGLTGERDFTIGVPNVNEAPTNLTLSKTAVPENRPAGTVVGTLAAADPDAGSAFTYSLVPNTYNNASFALSGNQLKTRFPLNYEAKAGFKIRLRVTDRGGLFFDRDFVISVTNVNEAPTNLTLSKAAVPENRPAGTVVGTLAAADPDAGAAFTYSLVPNTFNNASFALAGNRLKTKFVLNYEVKRQFKIRLRVTDQGGLFFDRDFVVTVTDVPE